MGGITTFANGKSINTLLLSDSEALNGLNSGTEATASGQKKENKSKMR